MSDLSAQLHRLFLHAGQTCQRFNAATARYEDAGALTAQTLAQHVGGDETVAIDLLDSAVQTRLLLLPFAGGTGKGAQHWSALCAVANALQAELGLPAPAVSINGRDEFCLWMSLSAPVPLAQAQRFVSLLRRAYAPPDDSLAHAHPHAYAQPHALAQPNVHANAAMPTSVELPPCMQRDTGKWAAFIHPGMGDSFIDEQALDFAPPHAAQAAFLDGVRSIDATEFSRALDALTARFDAIPVRASATPAQPAARDGLLLKDATLDDIVQFLQSKHIEPTFRFLTPPR